MLSASVIPCAHGRLRPQHQCPVVNKGRPKNFVLTQQHPRCASPAALPLLLLWIPGLVLTAWIADSSPKLAANGNDLEDNTSAGLILNSG